MNIHPLTPRKPTLPANCAGVTAGSAVTILGLCLLIQIRPPVGWLHHIDAPVVADLHFLAGMLAEMFSEAISSRSPLTAAMNLVALPEKVVAALLNLDIVTHLAIRGAAAAIAGSLIGLRVHSLVSSATVARPDVQHVHGPQFLTGRAARQTLHASWSRRFRTPVPGIHLADGVVMPQPLETEHMLVVGGTGAGKTTILQTVM